MTTDNVIYFKRPVGYIAIICAIPPEFEALRQVYKIQKIEYDDQFQFFETEEGIAVFMAGMGAERAWTGAEFVFNRWNSKTIIDFGIAGALVSGLSVGDVVLMGKEIDAEFPKHILRGSVRVTEGKICSQTHDVTSVEERNKIAKDSKAIAVTWETASIQKFTIQKNIHFFSARMISDCDEMDMKAIRSPQMLRRIRDAADVLKQLIG